jgi:hypothetical protein
VRLFGRLQRGVFAPSKTAPLAAEVSVFGSHLDARNPFR